MSNALFIGSDHAGFEMKEVIKAYVKESHPTFVVTDVGTNSTESVDYPIFAHRVGHAVVKNKAIGILICGTGIGISIAANKIRGVRCALCSDTTSAHLTKEHNDANILAFGARIVGVELAKDIVSAFLTTEFSRKENHARRIAIIEAVDKV